MRLWSMLQQGHWLLPSRSEDTLGCSGKLLVHRYLQHLRAMRRKLINFCSLVRPVEVDVPRAHVCQQLLGGDAVCLPAYHMYPLPGGRNPWACATSSWAKPQMSSQSMIAQTHANGPRLQYCNKRCVGMHPELTLPCNARQRHLCFWAIS